MPEFDIGFPWVIQGKGLRQILRREYLRFQAVRDLIAFFREHDAAGDAGVSFPDRCHRRERFAVAPAVILFVDQISVPRYQESAMLAGAGCIFKRPIQLAEVHARDLSNAAGIRQCAPATIGIGPWKVVVLPRRRGSRQSDHQKQHSDGDSSPWMFSGRHIDRVVTPCDSFYGSARTSASSACSRSGTPDPHLAGTVLVFLCPAPRFPGRGSRPVPECDRES